MSSVFSRKITMSTAPGSFTGDGTPRYQRTGRRHTYRSSSWRSATFSERMPLPIGVVSGPLMPMRYSRKASTVAAGSQSPVSRNAFSPASTSRHPILRSAERPLDRGVHDPHGSPPDVRSGAVAFDVGDDGAAGH